jgi:hypothetical protein
VSCLGSFGYYEGPGVLALLELTAHGLQGIADGCRPDSENAKVMRQRVREFDGARRVIADLLQEAEKAHAIILNALTVMTPEQQKRWAELNGQVGVTGEGATRYHERAAVIERMRSLA